MGASESIGMIPDPTWICGATRACKAVPSCSFYRRECVPPQPHASDASVDPWVMPVAKSPASPSYACASVDVCLPSTATRRGQAHEHLAALSDVVICVPTVSIFLPDTASMDGTGHGATHMATAPNAPLLGARH